MDYLQLYCQLSLEQQRLYERYATLYGISSNTLVVLRVFYLQGNDVTQTQILERTSLPKQTVHSIVKDLLRKNWLQQQKSASDRRRKLLSLTETGRSNVRSILEPLELVEKEAFHQIPLSAQEVIVHYFSVFNQRLEEKLRK